MNSIEQIVQWQTLAGRNKKGTHSEILKGLGYILEEWSEAATASGLFKAVQVQHTELFSRRCKTGELFIENPEAFTEAARLELADAGADIIWFAVQLIMQAGYDVEKVLAAVQESNDSKLVDGKFQYNEYGKVIKPEGYRLPNFTGCKND